MLDKSKIRSRYTAIAIATQRKTGLYSIICILEQEGILIVFMIVWLSLVSVELADDLNDNSVYYSVIIAICTACRTIWPDLMAILVYMDHHDYEDLGFTYPIKWQSYKNY